jgi:hypothetical protein
MKSAHSYRADILLATGACIMGFIVMEIVLRLLGISYPYFSRVHPIYGFAPRPGAEGWQTNEGKAFVKINTLGFRESLLPSPKKPDEFRIVALGDSYTEGLQVDASKRWTSVLQNSLSSCSVLRNKKIHVINLGVSGYGTAQEALVLQHAGLLYDPDMVILLFYAGNDVSDNNPVLRGKSGDAPIASVTETGGIAFDMAFQDSAFFRRQNSLLFQGLHRVMNGSRVLQLLNQVRKIAMQTQSPSSPNGNDEIGLDMDVYKKPTMPAWIAAWRTTEALLRYMRDIAQKHDARFLIVSAGTDVQESPHDEDRAALMQRLNIATLSYPDTHLRAFARESSIFFATLADELQMISKRDNVFMNGFSNTRPGHGHWNEIGHRAAGGIIARDVCALLTTP